MYYLKVIKLIYLIFIFIISLSNNYVFSQETKEILKQKERVEFEFKFLDRNYWTIKNDKNIIVISDYETGDKLIWKFKFLDQKLNIYREEELSLDRSYRLIDHYKNQDKILILFKKNYSSDKEYKIIILHNKNDKIEEYQINSPFSFRVKKIISIEENIILSGKSYQNKSIVVLYKTNTNQLKILSGFYKLNQEILDIKVDLNFKNFKVVFLYNNLNSGSFLISKKFSKSGDEISELKINSKNYSIINGKFYEINDKDFVVIGTYGKRKSKYSRGLFFTRYINNIQKEIKYIEYSDLNNFFYYLKDKKEKKIKERINKKSISNKKIKLNYNLILDNIIKNESEFLISGESYFEEYNDRGFNSTITFYNSYSGNYDLALDPNFAGFNHTHSIIVGFNIDGDLLWDNHIEINDINSIKEKKYTKVNLNYNTDNLALIYFHQGVINVKLINKNKNLTEKKSFNIITKNESDVIWDSEKIMEGFEHWHDNFYYAHGIQKIKNSKDSDVKLNRRVFYINKIELIN